MDQKCKCVREKNRNNETKTYAIWKIIIWCIRNAFSVYGGPKSLLDWLCYIAGVDYRTKAMTVERPVRNIWNEHDMLRYNNVRCNAHNVWTKLLNILMRGSSKDHPSSSPVDSKKPRRASTPNWARLESSLCRQLKIRRHSNILTDRTDEIIKGLAFLKMSYFAFLRVKIFLYSGQ